jgi:hypothetical protein
MLDAMSCPALQPVALMIRVLMAGETRVSCRPMINGIA